MLLEISGLNIIVPVSVVLDGLWVTACVTF